MTGNSGASGIVAAQRDAVAHDAIVLAGGRGSRLGGIDKTALTIDGVSLAALAIRAVSNARAVAYVSHAPVPRWVAADRRIRVAGEEPPWGGPVPAIAAGLAGLDDDAQQFTVVLAGDLVGAAPAVAELLARVPYTVDGVIGVDPDGHRQPLLAVYRTPALAAAVADVLGTTGGAPSGSGSRMGRGKGASMRAVLDRLEVRGVALRDSWCADVDTAADAARHGIAVPTGEVRCVRVA
ncbi:molybdopterin-guanine dinucleotide biosynthesis protein [Agromyces badenianii]|uniref:Molybdopterin-guanine dinucleotide biosynthesis protein n=1 Tax=Agromyces badenianii TaxID=2080742 RepID=A0A2S0WX40_9MICO|nr:NTP transferase domain-containing protein [Agromyces badenianii]AWB95774.1 molybdopterin-guanine dinucleotide biosynthesis protein [Agromyces badenianii]